jgi:hypothetical protein
VAAAVLAQAIKEMRYRGEPHARHHPDIDLAGHRLPATLWLGSQLAEPWFALLELEQEYALAHMGWVNEARQLLGDGEIEMTYKERQVLLQGIQALTMK